MPAIPVTATRSSALSLSRYRISRYSSPGEPIPRYYRRHRLEMAETAVAVSTMVVENAVKYASSILATAALRRHRRTMTVHVGVRIGPANTSVSDFALRRRFTAIRPPTTQRLGPPPENFVGRDHRYNDTR